MRGLFPRLYTKYPQHFTRLRNGYTTTTRELRWANKIIALVSFVFLPVDLTNNESTIEYITWKEEEAECENMSIHEPRTTNHESRQLRILRPWFKAGTLLVDTFLHYYHDRGQCLFFALVSKFSYSWRIHLVRKGMPNLY